MKNLTILFLFLCSIVNAQVECELYGVDEPIEMYSISTSSNEEVCHTFRVAIHVIYSEFNGNEVYDIPDEQLETAIISFNTTMANEGHKYHEDHTPSDIRLELHGTTHTNGVEQFGEEYQIWGVTTDNGNGVSSSEIRNYVEDVLGYSGDEYLNVFIYNKKEGSSGTTGFAWLASPNLGMFVRHDRIGDAFYEDDYGMNFAGSPDNSTFLHEAFHVYGLFHTFQNTDDCTPETNPLLQGDRVADSEPEYQSFGCHDVCGHNSRNYMSYKSCKDVLTEGQLERAYLVIAANQHKFGGIAVCPTCEPNTDGDLNGDGLVTIADMSLLNAYFNCEQGDLCYDDYYDSDCNGVINIADVSYYGQFFNTSSSRKTKETTLKRYDLLGREVDENYKGFVIERKGDQLPKLLYAN